MMSKNPALFLYVTSGLLFLFSLYFKSEDLMLVVKPMIIPSILYYYFTKRKNNINSIFVISVIFFFVGDMLFLINYEDFFVLGMLIFLIPYLFVIFFLYEDIKQIIAKRENNKIDFTFIVILLILLNLMITVLKVLELSSLTEEILYLLFGIELVTMGVMASMIYFHSSIKRNFYLAITISTFIISDLFFVLNKNIQNLLVFELINGTAQTVSYFFYINYFLHRNFKQ